MRQVAIMLRGARKSFGSALPSFLLCTALSCGTLATILPGSVPIDDPCQDSSPDECDRFSAVASAGLDPLQNACSDFDEIRVWLVDDKGVSHLLLIREQEQGPSMTGALFVFSIDDSTTGTDGTPHCRHHGVDSNYIACSVHEHVSFDWEAIAGSVSSWTSVPESTGLRGERASKRLAIESCTEGNYRMEEIDPIRSDEMKRGASFAISGLILSLSENDEACSPPQDH